MKEKAKNTIQLELDPTSKKKFSAQEKLKMDAISEQQIDYTDIPEISDQWFLQAARAKEMKIPTKNQISLRVDADILEFFKSHGSRYQTRINAVLRAYVEAHKPH